MGHGPKKTRGTWETKKEEIERYLVLIACRAPPSNASRREAQQTEMETSLSQTLYKELGASAFGTVSSDAEARGGCADHWRNLPMLA